MLGWSKPARQRTTALHNLFASSMGGMYVVPASLEPMSRVVVLCNGSLPSKEFVQQVVALAQVFDFRLQVLTAARSIGKARHLQELAGEAFSRHSVVCDFDLLAHSNVGASLARIARLRRCQVVAMEGKEAPAWLRWLRGNPVERLLGSLEGIGVLTLPATASRTLLPTALAPVDLPTGGRQEPNAAVSS
jgi:hypothetical protein